MFKAKGKLIYDPAPLRANFKARKEVSWCAKVEVPGSILNYYQHWIRKELRLNVNTPIWNAHITVVRYEEPRNKDAWRKYQGEIIPFEYDPEFKSDGPYFWLKVRCPRVEEIRQELGLPARPRVPLHITIGNTKNLLPIKEKAVPYRLFPWEA